jgi:hypothetical protein
VHSPARGLGDLIEGRQLGPLEITVSPAANERYWSAAGVSHPLLAAGALYPPIVANLTILLVQTAVDDALLHTAQRLVCHRQAEAGTPLSVTGRVSERFEKRGREYATVTAVVSIAGADPLWTSVATFTGAQL